MKNTAKVLLVLVQNDRPMDRKELRIETGLSEGVLSGTIFFLKKRELILKQEKSIKKPPFKEVKHTFNPKKGEILILLLNI